MPPSMSTSTSTLTPTPTSATMDAVSKRPRPSFLFSNFPFRLPFTFSRRRHRRTSSTSSTSSSQISPKDVSRPPPSSRRSTSVSTSSSSSSSTSNSSTPSSLATNQASSSSRNRKREDGLSEFPFGVPVPGDSWRGRDLGSMGTYPHPGTLVRFGEDDESGTQVHETAAGPMISPGLPTESAPAYSSTNVPPAPISAAVLPSHIITSPPPQPSPPPQESRQKDRQSSQSCGSSAEVFLRNVRASMERRRSGRVSYEVFVDEAERGFIGCEQL
ncbi:hypothetical protein BCR34DRAFT_571620 [Clohesyomyces aquaticus]|uniref:Uncharacterized protein n=1 Tax=Clohesyomyces aquaticus TaxID=1231657 RepID=A0A1Y1Z6Z1_9PLEO|nr:hypothetical protein BCR34DRAFT_571620 [Clohesyomyces aquaticus]